MQKISPITCLLFILTLGLFSLSLWSLTLYTRLQTSPLKGIVFLVYGLILSYFIWRTLLRPRTQAVLLGSLVVGVIGAEVLTRQINPPPEDPDYRQGAPYVMFAGQPNGLIEKSQIRLNELGYRDLPALPKPAGEFRVIMLGGSTVFLGEPRQFSIAGALELDLHQHGYSQVKVYNWGVFSVVSGQELATILFRAVDYEPDLIVVYNGANDLGEPYFFDPRPQYPFDYMATEGGRRIIEGEWGLFDLYAVLLRRSSLGYTLFQFEIQEQITRQSQLAEAVGFGSEVWRQAIATGYGKNLSKMCQLSRAFDVQLAAVLQPMIFFKDHLVGDEPNWQGDADYQTHIRESYALARAEFSRLSQEYPSLDCFFVDGSYFLQAETGELFIDPVHLTDEGNVIMGGHLGELLGSQVIIR